MLGLDPMTVLFQAINFLVLAYLLNRMVFRPVLERSQARRREQDQQEHALEQEKLAIASMKDELEARLRLAEDEAAEKAEQIRVAAIEEREAIIQEASSEAERVLRQAQLDAQNVLGTAVRESSEALVDTVLAVTATTVERVLPAQVHSNLVGQLIERIRELGRTDMRRVEAFRRSLGTREPIAHVSSAQDLSPEQQGQLARILTSLADRHVQIELQTDSSLVAGVRLRIGDLVIDDSISGQLDALRGSVLVGLSEQVSSG